MAKMGRPRKEIDQKQFENLCQLQCTHEEICAWFDVNPKTLEKWCKETYGKGMTFSKVFTIKRAGGHISLRRSQYELAKKNAAMAIFLGKNWLGQSDNPRQAERNEDDDKRSGSFINALRESCESAYDVEDVPGNMEDGAE